VDISREDWKIIIAYTLKKYNDDYDTLVILLVETIGEFCSVNYKTTKGNWSTGFGTLKYKKSNILVILRKAKLNLVLDE